MKSLIIYFKEILFGIMCFAILQSCEDVDTKGEFPQVPSVRVANKIKDVQQLLTSSEQGWKTTYFPDNTKLGGYTFLFKFKENKEVEMTSDFQRPKPINLKGNTVIKTKITSKYDIVLGSTVKLSFGTYSKIHELAMADWFVTDREAGTGFGAGAKLRGKGYKGDFEFLYYGQDGEDLIFRSNRDFIKLRFKKATADDWKNVSKDKINYKSKLVSENEKMIQNILSNKDLPFHILKVGDKFYNFSYNIKTRRATGTPQKGKKLRFGVGFTPAGIIISPPIDVQGTKVDTFAYDKDKNRFVAGVEGEEKAAIYWSDFPEVLSPKYNFEREKLEYIELMTTQEYPLTTKDESNKKFINFFNKWRNDFEKVIGKEILSVRIRDFSTKSPYLEILLYVARGFITSHTKLGLEYTLTKDTEKDREIITFKMTGKNDDLQGISMSEYKPILDFIFRKDGFYFYKRPGKVFGSYDKIGLITVGDTMFCEWWVYVKK